MGSPCARKRTVWVLAVALCALAQAGAAARGDEMQWIWSPAQFQDRNVPAGTCYFRKSFSMGQPETGEVQIACDDDYELYVNGSQIGDGKNWRTLGNYDIKRYLSPGRNTVAVKATNSERGPAGLVARIVVKEAGGTHVAYNTDATWRTSTQEFRQWTKYQYNDAQWMAAKVIGPLGTTAPWLDEVQTAGGAPAGRFETLQEFRVETVVPPSETGSLLGMTFNEFGELLVSREGSGILLFRHTNPSDTPQKAETYCDQVTNCQGLLALNGSLFVVGTGPDGQGLYRLIDEDGDRQADKVETLLKFTGDSVEHGPHGVTLGPDGLLYIVLGNHARVEQSPQASSPMRIYYEGDLVTPKYEDPHGEATGIKAPGGTIVRTDVNGSLVELFAGGLRNCYDLAFNSDGELFTYESDMEWDVGLPWYRPTRVLHVTPGAEFGWRSGWSVWPEYFFDSLPSLLRSGRGSPTGVTVYNHLMFPRRYHDAVFLGDWSRGRILALRLIPDRGTYKTEVQTFAVGKPLNVTDLEVGPEGALYFCTGGRGTQGGVYRIVWRGRVPDDVTNLGQGIQQAIRQPQLNSAFARQKIAFVKQQLGTAWESQLAAIVLSPSSTTYERCRALDLMHLFGPFPTTDQLARVAGDRDPLVRAKAAYLMGVHSDEATQARLLQMLHDNDPMVQRASCESLARAGQIPPLAELLPLLSSGHRHVAYAATRLLETMPRDYYRPAVLTTNDHRLFVQGALALLVASPDRETCTDILNRALVIMQGFVSDPDFTDMLRVMELALERGGLESIDVPQLAERMAAEYPTRNAEMNRQLVRLIVYLQGVSAAGPMLEQLADDLPVEDKMHVALYARFLHGWTTPQKLELLKFYETARTYPGGHSFTGYIDNVSRDFFAGLNEQELAMVLADGAKWPNSSLAVLAKLPPELPRETIDQIIALDRQMVGVDSEAARRLAIGVIAVLGRCHDPRASTYLHEMFEKNPERRGYIAMALTQNPDGDNWPLLVQSLPVIDGDFAQEVLKTLARIDRRPDQPEAYRQAILRGLKLGDEGGQHAVKLLEKWAGKQLSQPAEKPTAALAAWQKWFTETYPNEPEPSLPVESAENNWTYDELLAYLTGPQAAQASAQQGSAIYAKAQCANCHRYGDRGEGHGPELTTVSRRFQKKEILESILFPSHVISDQYASKTVLTNDGRVVTGMVAPQADGSLVVLQSNGDKLTVAADNIDTTTPSKKSAMPEGLLNSLTLEEIADLFAYLNQRPQANITSRRPAGAASTR